ncbi:MAG TPA: hypothetical protein PKG74_03055, partial [Candidatus Colwellbacteria bacterium]|nr:hypothetical protein [Candidatus Colwellbacteria bacterium]
MKKEAKHKKKKKSKEPTKPDHLRGKHKPEEFRQYGLFMALPTEERKEIFGFSTDAGFSKKFKVN